MGKDTIRNNTPSAIAKESFIVGFLLFIIHLLCGIMWYIQCFRSLFKVRYIERIDELKRRSLGSEIICVKNEFLTGGSFSGLPGNRESHNTTMQKR